MCDWGRNMEGAEQGLLMKFSELRHGFTRDYVPCFNQNIGPPCLTR